MSAIEGGRLAQPPLPPGGAHCPYRGAGHPAARQPGARAHRRRRRASPRWWPRTERGLLLTCLWYIREVDPSTLLLTGLTFHGVYVIEDGAGGQSGQQLPLQREPGRPAWPGATEAGSRRCRRSGREFGEWVNRTRMPALRVPDFNMSSVSPAS